MTLYRDEGVVLRTHKLGEADRIVVLMTDGRGKVRAVAKGVRKTKSRFGGRLEPPSRVSLLCHQGRQLDVVTQVETIDAYRSTREDLVRATDAIALLEAVDQVAQEGEANRPLYRMLTAALATLAARPSPLLVAGFYWKLLALEGVAPVLDRCSRCGIGQPGQPGQPGGRPGGFPVELVSFDPAEGGMLCRGCRRGTPVGPDALALIRRILGGDLAGALAEAPSPATATVVALATTALEAHLERRLRAVRLLHGA